MILTLLSSITHDLRVAAPICDTIVVMQNGRIVEAGAAETVLTAPQQKYTRDLIEAVPGRDWDFQNFRPAMQMGPRFLRAKQAGLRRHLSNFQAEPERYLFREEVFYPVRCFKKERDLAEGVETIHEKTKPTVPGVPETPCRITY
jgi:ABC-type glutathione transport system ATPase component